MAKKRKASGRNAQPSGPREVDPSDARLGPIQSYKDVADSEDEYFMDRDQIMFDEEPQSKRRRRKDEEDEFLEQSDEEVLDVGDDDSEGEEDEEASAPRKGAPRRRGESEDEDQARSDVEGGDSGWWGDSKTDYYDADQIETEADALEEEAEAKKLQQKKLSKMAEEDFLFDEADWLASKDEDGKEEEGDEDVVTEVLKDIEIPDDMSPEDRSKLLQSRYPEFEHLVNEFQDLRPLLVDLQKEANGKSGKSVEVIKYWVLGCYVAALASYFAVLTSPSRDGSATQKILPPSELRDHEVMETLVTCRQAWQRISGIRSASSVESSAELEEDVAMGDSMPSVPAEEDYQVMSREDKKQKKAKDKAQKAKAKRAKAVDESLGDLDDLLKPQTKPKKAVASSKRKAAAQNDDDDDSDFGEEEALDARTAADKAARKKSLRFYTSQIVQKANRRADAGRDAGGDTDIPYRERLRDRQARLNAEAERRGQKGSKHGADLGADGDESNDEDAAVAAAVRGAGADDEEYYDMVAAKSGKKRADKAALYEALAAANKADRVVEQEEVGEDGKRKISYAIEKNKGLAPKRKKDVRNPRVKKKKQYEAKQKKLRSMKQTFKGGEPRGGYGGEKTGITTGLVRSRKL